MNLYAMLGSAIGTSEGASLGSRLSAWHDAMVAHERRLRIGRTDDPCDDECPHAEARALWSEALAAFGPRAQELAFLRSRANAGSRRSKGETRRSGRRADGTSAAPAATAVAGGAA